MSVYISGEKNITFVHIPKTAGTSMLYWLINNRGSSDYIKWDIHPKHSTIIENRTPMFSFTVVRNPWDRMVSLYHYFKNIAVHEGSQFLKLNQVDMSKYPPFHEWILQINTFKIPPDYWFNGATAQQEWLDIKVDLVIRYENLTEEFKQVQDVFKCDIPLPHIYASGRGNYSEYYTDESKKFVEQLCQADIDLWKYSF